MATPKVEAVTSPKLLGEGPHWDHNAQVLYYVDALESIVCKYDPATKKETRTTKLDTECVSIVLPIKGEKNKFIITMNNELVIMTWDGENSTPTNIEHILTVEQDKPGNRFNDGKADPNGQLWVGTMGSMQSDGEFAKERGTLYSISKKRAVTPHVTNIGIANGLAWRKDLKYFYYIDSHVTKISQFNFDAANSKISNRQSVFEFEKHGVKGAPDGMTIDTEDKLWLACFYGGQVIRVDPATGNLMQRIEIPAPNVTSVAFGGPQLDELYVTTATFAMTPEQQKQFPSAGGLFKVTGLGVKGHPGVEVDI